MKVLVTGGGGFIGSHVAEFYAKKGYEVEVFDNLSRAKLLKKNTSNALFNWNYLKRNYPAIKFTKSDVRRYENLKTSCSGVDMIVHTAAQVAVTTSIVDPRTDFETNAIGSFNVLEAARANDAAVVFTSTNKVYGENVNRLPIVEKEKRYEFANPENKNGISEEFSTDLAGHSPYGCSKFTADIYLQEYAHTYGLKTGVFRMSCIYGERQFGVEDQGWVAWFTIASLTGKPITIYGDGKQVRDVLHVSDLVAVFDKFLNSKIKHDVFNIGGGPTNSLSLIELLSLLKPTSQKEINPSYVDWRNADQKVYISNITKANKALGWSPKIQPEKGVENLIKWCFRNRKLFD